MPDAGEDVERGVINNRYAYPNADSYRSFHRTNGSTPGATQLRHGWIWSMNGVTETTNASGGRTISTILGKKFQFNPVSLQFDIQMLDIDDASTLTPGGNSTGVGVGAANTGLSLVFNREIEVFRATRGDPSVPSYFKEIGVQKDVLDLYRVMLGENSPSIVAGQGEAGMAELTGELFDAAIVTNMSKVVVSFNPALTYYGSVMGMTYDYQKFNNNMVPTIAGVTLSISILHINSSKAIAGAVTSTAASATTSSTSVPNSGSSSSSSGSLYRPARGPY